MNKLIQLSDFVIEQERQRLNLRLEKKEISDKQDLKTICRYANFLKMPLGKWMFSQIDEEDGESLFKTLADTSSIEHHILQGRLVEYLVVFKPTLTQKAKNLIGI
jgi:hypothetical protein